MKRAILPILLLIAAVPILAASGAVAWRCMQRSQAIYTDGASIHMRVGSAAPREILWTPPVALQAAINTTDQEFEPHVSPDGRELFFVRGMPAAAGANADIYVCSRLPGMAEQWSDPQPLREINTDADEMGPVVSPDGSMLVFYSNRPGGVGGYDLWASRRGEDGWQTPENLGPAVNSEFNEAGAAFSADGSQLYFASNRPRPGDVPTRTSKPWLATVRETRDAHDYDLYTASIENGRAADVRALAALNTSHNEGTPAISAAGDFLYFCSDRPGGMGGFDLYRARILNGELQEPANLGAEVNGPANDLDPAMDLAGFGLHFSSDRRTPDARHVEAAEYNLYRTTSREVFLDEQSREPLVDWASLANVLLPSLLWLLLTLFSLLAVFWLFRGVRSRRLSLLARCVLASLMAHLVLLILLSFWQVTTALVKAAEGGGTRVAISSASVDGAGPGDLVAQIRGALTEVAINPASPAPTRIETNGSPAVEVAPVFLQSEPIAAAETGAVKFDLATCDAAVPSNASLPEQAVAVDGSAPTLIDAAAPGLETPMAAQEAAVTFAAVMPIHNESSQAEIALPSSLTTDTKSIALAPDLPRDESAPAFMPLVTSAPADAPAVQTRRVSFNEAARLNPDVSLPADNFAGDVTLPLERAAENQVEISIDSALATPGPSSARRSSKEVTVEPPSIAHRHIAPAAASFPPAAATMASPSGSAITDSPAPAASSFIDKQFAVAAGANLPPVNDVAGDALPLPPGKLANVATSQSEPAATGAGLRAANGLSTQRRVDVSMMTDESGGANANVQLAPASIAANSLLSPAHGIAEPAPADAPGRATVQQGGNAPVDLSGVTSIGPIDVPVPAGGELADPFMQRHAETRKELVQRMGGSEATEQAVALALKWLAAHQARDGRWAARSFDDGCGQCKGAGKFDTDVATTALAMLCFFAADHTHLKAGEYRGNVDRGLTWLLAGQKEDGDLRNGETMYSHGIASIALAEALGMTHDPKLVEPVRKAVEFIAASRNTRSGGWRYEPGQPGDTSVLGWQVMAMVSAKRAGIGVSSDAFRSAHDWLDRVSQPSQRGLYAYQPGQPHSASMTAEALFVQQLLGAAPDSPRSQMSMEYLLDRMPRWNAGSSTYYWYYGTLAMFQQQGDAWKRWNTALTEQLLANQRTAGAAAGSWDPLDNWARIGGRVYQTALCTLSLEVYYRYLPMYSAVTERTAAR